MFTKLYSWFYQFTQFAFTPSNKLTIKNIPRSWVDRDMRLFHAVFTILCDYIELEHDNHKQYVEWLEVKKEEDNSLILQWSNAYDTQKLYNWYINIDWNEYDYLDGREIMRDKLKEAIRLYNTWWT